MFDADPTLMAPSQRLAQAHAAMSDEKAIPDTQESGSDDGLYHEESTSTIPQQQQQQQKKTNGNSRDVNFNDEAAFPSLGGSSTTKSKSLWANVRPVKTSMPTASQVISASDLVTEVLKLDVDQQQARSLGKGQTGTIVTAVQKSTGTTIQMSTAQKTGTTTFLIKGKPEAVQAARKALLKELGKKVYTFLIIL